MSLIRWSQVTHVNESCHSYEWVMSRIWRSHVTHTHVYIGANIGDNPWWCLLIWVCVCEWEREREEESACMRACLFSRVCMRMFDVCVCSVRAGVRECVSVCVFVCVYVLRCFAVSLACGAPLIRDSFVCVTWLMRVCDMTHSFMGHDSFLCVTWLIHMCAVTHSCITRDSFLRVTSCILVCDMICSYVWHESFMLAWLIHVL